MSLASAGVAVIDIVDGELRIVHKQRIKTNPKQRHGERLHKIATELKAVMLECQPFDTVVREQGFSRFKNATQALFKVIGVSDLVLRDYAIAELTPTEVKKIVTGDGKADKLEVEKAVRRIMKLGDDYIFVSDDESDACAIILAYLIQNNIIDEKGKLL
ncbi:crossover junction endodeoxyribonuclease RuvC (plasmid) [Bacillus thuringiensis]|uniref:crossover junction endodeoxyribonuclease RuvC n=1 Tax=Bacillus thuringiensis TaxID=1428 RepID=UPI003D70C05E